MLARRLVVPATLAFFAAAVGAAACGSRTNLSCTTPLTVAKDVPSLYFVLDRSTSMRENGKWDAVRGAIAGLVRALGPSARFGAAVFPPPNADDGCMAGAEVMPLRLGDDGTAAYDAFLAATSMDPLGGTPTAETLRGLIPSLGAEPGPTFVVLATDGGPNCNDALMCDLATCTANIDHVSQNCNADVLPNCCDPTLDGPQDCLDADNTVAAVQALAAANIPTYVIGVPGSGPYGPLLDALARSGGTARAGSPLYYDVNTAAEGALTAALDEVARRVASSCFLSLTSAVSNPDGLVVTVDGAPVASGGADGFTFDLANTMVTLHGASCARLQAGGAVVISDVDECGRR